jgi:hypothetical protein
MTNAVNLASAAGTGFTLRNRIINGGFDVWQRGTSISLSNTALYTADRWVVGGASASVARIAFTNGQTEVPDNPKYYARWTISSNSQNYEFTQKIEGVQTFAGQTATVSFYIRQTSGSVTLNARLVQDFGTGGSPSSLVVTSVGSVPMTANWQRVIFTISVPSITGKTIGNDSNDSLWVSLQVTNTATGVIEIANYQAELGSVATPFERRLYGLEDLLCQRYYRVYNILGGFGTAPSLVRASAGANRYIGTAWFPTRMRASPSVTVTSTQVHKPHVRYDTIAAIHSVIANDQMVGFDVQPSIDDGSGVPGIYFSNGAIQANAEL